MAAEPPHEEASASSSLESSSAAHSEDKQTISSIRDEQWNAMFHRLIVYKQHHDDCKVPERYAPDKALGTWVRHQRIYLKNAPLNNERRRRLVNIGFAWQPAGIGSSWDDMFHRLVDYQQRHGDCNTPYRYPQDRQLGVWVCTQRRTLKDAPLDNERRQKLDRLGFTWQPKEKGESWDEMFNRLVDYQQQHGDCNTPYHYPQDRQLGVWVSNQRQNLKHAPFDNERRQKLRSIGFTWKRLEMPSWDDMFNRLVAFQQQHGNCKVPLKYALDKALGTWVNTQRYNLKNAPSDNVRRKRLDSINFDWAPRKRLVSESDHDDKVVRQAKPRRNASKQSSAKQDKVIRHYSSSPGVLMVICEGIHGPVVFGSLDPTSE